MTLQTAIIARHVAKQKPGPKARGESRNRLKAYRDLQPALVMDVVGMTLDHLITEALEPDLKAFGEEQ